MKIMTRLGALGLIAVCVLTHGNAFAQVQSKAQQGCINALNKSMAKVGGTTLKAVAKCTADFAKGKNMDALACYVTSTKVDTIQGKTCPTETKKCTEAPNFGSSSCGTVNGASEYYATEFGGDIFGNLDPNAGITDCSADKAACKCQAKLLKSSTKVYATRLKTYNKCKKAALKDKVAAADAPSDLAACMSDDGKGKIAKTIAKLGGTVTKSCAGVATPFAAGYCASLTGDALRDCLDSRTRCEACLTVQASDSLYADLDCELFDDGNGVNGSCQNDF